MKRLQEKEEKTTKKTLRIIKIVGVIVFVIFLVEIWMVNRLSTYGKKIQEIKVVKANLELENQNLENAIAQNSSLKEIENKAARLGFTSIKNLEYVKQPRLASAF